MTAARRREFDAIAVTKLDRLARSVHHLTSMAVEFEALGIDLVVIDQGIDTTTPASRLMFNVIGAIAEFERDLIRERTVAGLAAAKRRGKRLGRPVMVDKRTVERVRRLRSNDQSLAQIAQLLEISKSSVQRVAAR